MAFGFKPRDAVPLGPAVLLAHDRPILIGLHTQIAEGTQRIPVLDSLAQVEVDSGKKHARGETRLFFSGHSQLYIHGPDTLLPAVALTERLLHEKERVVVAEEVQFRKLTRCELALEAHEGRQFTPKEVRENNLLTRFHTSRNRTFLVKGKETRNPVYGGKWPGRLATTTHFLGKSGYCTITEDTASFTYEQARPLAMTHLEAASSGFQLATIFDFVLQAGAQLITTFTQNGPWMLAAGCKGICIPDLATLTRGSTITVSMKEATKKGPKFTFIPVNFTLQSPTKTSLGCGEVTIAIPNTQSIERAYSEAIKGHTFAK